MRGHCGNPRIWASFNDPTIKNSQRFKAKLALNRWLFFMVGSLKLAEIRGFPQCPRTKGEVLQQLHFSCVTAVIQLCYTIWGQIIIKFDLSSCFLQLACHKLAGIRGFCTRVYCTPFPYPAVARGSRIRPQNRSQTRVVSCGKCRCAVGLTVITNFLLIYIHISQFNAEPNSHKPGYRHGGAD